MRAFRLASFPIRRLASVEIDLSLLLEFLQPNQAGTYRCPVDDDQAIPSKAKLVRAELSTSTGRMVLVLEHESFQPVRLGNQIPQLLPQFETKTLPKEEETEE